MSAKAASTEEGSGSEAPPAKRQKISLACEECRKQKIKCDGNRPVCLTCIRRNQSGSCVYRGDKPPERGHACSPCKSRKIKCDGGRPICQNCSKRGLGAERCIYADGSEVKNGTPSRSISERPEGESRASARSRSARKSTSDHEQRSYIQMLESRVQELERNVRQPEFSTPTRTESRQEIVRTPRPAPFDPPSGVLIPESSPPVLYSYAASHHAFSPPQPSTGQTVAIPAEGTRESSPEETDAMGAVENTSPGAAGGFFGSSSAMSFVKQIRRAIQEKGMSHLQNSSSKRSLESPISTPSPSHRRIGSWGSPSILRDQLLPQRKVADDLVDSYFFYVHPLYPFLHTPTFLEEYSRLWVNAEGNGPDPLFHCTLQLVFALGCQFCANVPLVERESTADVFFRPASKNLVNFENLHSASLPLVQALLLMAQYLQATNLPNQCWIVVGIATRLAQSLGLHLRSSTLDPDMSLVEVEMRRRIWHGCLLLDRAMCMIFGRPSCISHVGTCPIPLAIDDELLGIQLQEDFGKPSTICFFVHTLSLYEILFEILNTFYGSSTEDILGTNPADAIPKLGDFNAVLRLDEKLETWEGALPEHLKFPPKISDQDEHLYHKMYRQSVVLQCRYLHTRILLYRPLLIEFFTSGDIKDRSHRHKNTKLQESMMFRCSLLCSRAAQSAVALVKANVDSGAIPAWWYSAYYIYTASCVILTTRLCTPLRDEFGSSLEDTWSDALELLQQFGVTSKSAKRCYWILKKLESGLPGSSSGDPNNSALVLAQDTEPNAQSDANVVQPRFDTADDPSGVNWAFDPGDLAWLTNIPFDSILEGFPEF